jgi:hypothetical protein
MLYRSFQNFEGLRLHLCGQPGIVLGVLKPEGEGI